MTFLATVMPVSTRLVVALKHVRIKQLALFTCGCWVALLLVACAMGTNIVRPAADDLTLGVTTKESTVARYGKPDNSGETVVNGHNVKVMGYSYVDASGRSHVPGVTAGRSLSLNFVDDKLVGYVFTSSFEEDHTDFDASRVSEIEKGKSTKTQVIALLGQPNGKVIYPLVDKAGIERFLYKYFHVDIQMGLLKAKGKVFQKQLAIDFNDNDIVTDVEYTSQDTKM